MKKHAILDDKKICWKSLDDMKKPMMTFLFDYFKPLYIDVFWFQNKNNPKQPYTTVGFSIYIYHIIYSNKKP